MSSHVGGGTSCLQRSERYTSATVCASIRSYVIMHISIHTSDCLGVILMGGITGGLFSLVL